MPMYLIKKNNKNILSNLSWSSKTPLRRDDIPLVASIEHNDSTASNNLAAISWKYSENKIISKFKMPLKDS